MRSKARLAALQNVQRVHDKENMRGKMELVAVCDRDRRGRMVQVADQPETKKGICRHEIKQTRHPQYARTEQVSKTKQQGGIVMLIALICIGVLLGGIAALLWWIGRNVESVRYLMAYDVYTYLVVKTQEYATCTPFVEKKIVRCMVWDLEKYLKNEDANVKVTVTKLD